MIAEIPSLTLAEARALARRAVNKAEELTLKGAFVVVDDGGVPLSASRMDGTGAMGIPISRAKAYIAAANRETSENFANRMSQMFVGIYMAYQNIARDRVFPGPGAVPIHRDGVVIGAISTGASIGPFCKFDGVDPSMLVVDGHPANAEDLIISYALRSPYRPQHGDDMKRWVAAYGAPPSVGQGTGLSDAPAATRQAGLDAAIRIVDVALAEATRRDEAVAVAVVDRHGDLVQLDRMDEAPPMSPDAAEAVAVAALNFRTNSDEIAPLAREYPDLARISEVTRVRCLAVPGGVPLRRANKIVGAVGVSGARLVMAQQIAVAAAAAFSN